jgi:hypothetical protein
VADKSIVQGIDGDNTATKEKYCFNIGGAPGENHAAVCKKGVCV